MISLTQNNKIAISAIAIFVISFASMVFFLEGARDLNGGNASVLGAGTHEESSSETVKIDLNDEAQYRSYLDNTEYPIVVLNGEGAVKYASNDMCKLLAIRCSNFIGDLFFDYINTKDLPTLVADHLKLTNAKDGEIKSIGPYRMVRKDKEILVLFTGVHLKTEKDHSIIISVQDITEQTEGLNVPSDEPLNKDELDTHWIEDIYPNIQDKKDQGDTKLVVDKITYKE